MHRFLTVLVVGLAVVFSAAIPASAARAVVSDPRGDAPAGVDIVSAKYVNADGYVKFRVKVRDLGRGGVFDFAVAQPRTDESLVARVTRNRVRWGIQDNVRTRWIGCAGDSYKWLEGRNVVQVRVPRACLDRRGYRGALYMQATTNNGYGDFVASRVVRRG